jgi:phage gp16-like protein
MISSIAAIHVGLKQLGISEDDDKRALYARVTGKTRLTLMKPAEQEAVLGELRRLGFAAAPRRADGRQQLTGKFAKKLQALWIGAWNLGLVDNRDDAALVAFVKRQTGLDQVRFLHHADDARKVVEALKSWMQREARVMFGNLNGQDWLAADGAKIAWAQWRILNPGADLIARKGFDQSVFTILGQPACMLQDLKPKEWQTVMNELGRRIRAARKGGG